MLSLGLSKEKLTEHSELQKRSVSFLHDFVYLLIVRGLSTSIIIVSFSSGNREGLKSSEFALFRHSSAGTFIPWKAEQPSQHGSIARY
jgi:hypothetical protein